MDQPALNAEHWQLITELLQSEARQLPTEIHHAGLAATKQRLRHRRDLVNELLALLGAEPTAAEL